MMPHATARLAGLALAIGIVAASPVSVETRQFDGTRPQPGIECTGFLLPNFGDCREIINGNRFFGRGDEITVCVNPRQCRIWRNGNCRISFCNNENTESCDSSNEWGRRTDAIIDFCAPKEGGYESAPEPKPWTEVAVRANTDFFMAADASAVADVASEETKYEEMTVEEDAAEVKRLEALSKQLSSQTKQLSARADSFQVSNRRLNTERPGAQQEISGVLENGFEFNIEESDSRTEGVTTSVSLGSDLFGVMTAGIGVDISSSYTVSSSTGISVTIDCGNSPYGVVVWFPLFNYYEGTFQPSGEPGYIWVPLDGSISTSNYRVRCLG